MLSEAQFRRELGKALKSKSTLAHPILMELFQPKKNPQLLRLFGMNTYPLTRMFERYVAALFYNCPAPSFRRNLASNLYEEVTGALSQTDGHLELMQKFLRALGISNEEMERAEPLPETRELLEFRRKLCEDPARYHMGAAAVMIASEGQTIQKESGVAPHKAIAALYGLSEDDIQFFSVHAEEDVDHVREGFDIVCAVCTTEKMQQEAIATVRDTVELFWRHYDGIQREYQRLGGVLTTPPPGLTASA
ncbi:TenA family transcriptional regulator [Hyalangium versicolor]|uniref:TenA family transcriptional regulator n=1 Tax=Hyalangium versicolor TaxID=2861190 RepID=UPI001CCAAD8B|nr:iron-containing redox enzyme family protein [Hyalangium versicolor]